MKVTGLELISEMVAERELKKKKERDVRNDRIKQLAAQGIDKEIAEVMVDAFTACGF
ncbi:MAG: hypothetical protein NC452_05290 [Eubacterium sp.]|nr:hypothetical protein [Eubacterium sp.]